jgi:hypothetical protein
VLLSVSNVPAHIWSADMIQEIIGSSCLVFEVAPSSSDRFDLSSFLVVAWACRPDLIPTEVGCSIPEPVEPFVKSKLPLFLRVSEILHSMCDLLHFRAFVRLLEVHDFNLPSGCSGDDYRLPSNDSSDEDYPGYDPGRGILNPCPKVSRLATGSSPTGDFWLSLPTASGGVWSSFESGVTSKAIGSSGVVPPPDETQRSSRERAPAAVVTTLAFVTTARGVSSGSMHTGVIPSSLKAFLEAVSKEIPSAALPAAPP